MLSKLAKACLVSTSFAPVLVTYAFVLWIGNKPIREIVYILFTAILLMLLCLYVLSIAKKKIQIVDFTISSIKTADSEVLGFLVAYLIPFATLASDQINGAVLIFIFGLFLLVIWSTNSYHINPLLTLFGYHFYEVTTRNNITFLLITKRDLRNTTSVKKVIQLTEYMVFDVKEES
ncbi:MAG: hypothetical protein ACOWWO_11515 [Peptococcaceae bacterium]